MLELKNVSLSYGDLRVLRDVCLRLDPGKRIAVMGPSGCGKTSLLRVIAGLQSPDSGTVERTAQRLSFVFQEPRLLPWLTAAENVRLVLPDAHHGEDSAVWLSRFGLSDAADKLPAELSGGMQQLVSLARALVCAPDLLLLDEPTRGIDVGAKYEIYQLILDLANKGKTVIMVSSEMPELLGVCDRILVMSGGRLAGEVDAKTATQEDIMRLAAKYV